MDATTTRSIASLLAKLKVNYPNFAFTASDEFRWSPKEKTIFYDSSSDNALFLLHELSHAILGHDQYTRDIELVELERSAWDYAEKRLCKPYLIPMDSEVVEDSLDTYRDWLHSRSTCPACQSTGIETKKYEYRCIACATTWRVNDARVCALRRKIIA